MGVTRSQTSWLMTCELHRLQPVCEPDTKMKHLLSSAERGLPEDRKPFVSTVILRRDHPHPDPPPSRGREYLVRRSSELLEERLCLFQIGVIEALGEPAVDRPQQLARFGAASLIATQPREAHSGAQFRELGLLLLGDAQGF